MKLCHKRHKWRRPQADDAADFSTKTVANPRQKCLTYIMVYKDDGRDSNRQEWQRQKLTQHTIVHRLSRPTQMAAASMMVARHAVTIARIERMDVCGRKEKHRQEHR